MKLEEVTEARSTVNAHQDAILHGGAEAHSQAVRARAGPIVGRPGIQDEAPAFPKDVGSASCGGKERGSHQGCIVHCQLQAHCGDCTGSCGEETAPTCLYLATERDGIQSLGRRLSPYIKDAGKTN